MKREVIEKFRKSLDYLLLNLTLPVAGERKYIVDSEKLKTYNIKNFSGLPDYELIIKSDYIGVYLDSRDEALKMYIEKYLSSWNICDFIVILKKIK